MRLLPPLLGLALAASGCIETRISVDVLTQVHADGTCSRRIEYRLERVDGDKGDRPVEIAPADDRLRQFRIPSGEPWRWQEIQQTGLHVVTVEAELPSPAAADGDFYRLRSPKGAPARNFVSASSDPQHGSYEYQEVIRDPASPLAGARLLSRLALKAEEGFARTFAEAIAETAAPPREGELRRLYRELFAAPFAREVGALAERPLYGPRERRELEEIFDALALKQAQLSSRILSAMPDAPAEAVDAATQKAVDALGDGLIEQLEAAGLPLGPGGERLRVHATLVMPVPIVRANTCASGETAEWEFDQDDIFGRGFEMKALAAAR